jgi:hypothetical protein
MTISDRAIALIEISDLNTLTRMGDTNYPRWSNVKRRKARVGADEIEILGNMFPEYRWWLLTGEACPEIGQSIPDIRA